MKDYEELLEDARRISTKLVQEIATHANGKYPDGPKVFAGLAATLVLQTMLTTFALDQFKPGAPEGDEWFQRMYHEALKDALERWKQPDLKVFNHKVQ
jgi:hypothetical protein